MFKGFAQRWWQTFACALVLWLSVTSAEATAIRYFYDALGRVTFVVDPVNGNRDYDYDAAGNRLLVARGAATDSSNEHSTAPPSAPSSLSHPSNSITGSYQVEWGPAAGNITRYELWEAGNAAFTGETRVFNAPGYFYSASRGDGTYYYRARACNADLCGAFRSSGSHTTVLRIPGVPGDMSIPIVAIPGNSYSVGWGAASGSTVAHYEIEQHGNSTFSALVGSWQRAASPLSLTASTESVFYFRVRACNASGCSAFRNGTTGITVTYPPATPTGLSAQLYSFCTWGARWDVMARATNYNVRDARNNNINTTQNQASIVWSTNCPATGQPSDNPPVWMNACNLAGCSGAAYFNTLPPPTGPGSLSIPATAAVGGSYAVNWSSSGGSIDRYELEQFSDANFTVRVQGWNLGAPPFNVPASSEGTFYFRIRACNASGCSGYTHGSNAVTIIGAPAAPSGLTMQLGSFCVWAARWNAVPGATRYVVTDTHNATQSVTSTSASVLWSSTCPQGNPNYNMPKWVKACNTAGCSANSSF
jgi:YD repeat-containing protein